MRSKLEGGNQAYWDKLGYVDVSGSDANETMMMYDQPLHYNMTLNLETNSWEYESDHKDFLEPKDPAIASQLFSYQLAPSSLKSVAEYSSDNQFQKAFKTGVDGFSGFINKMRSDNEYVRSAINEYIQDNPTPEGEQSYNVYDFLEGRVPAKFPSVEEIVSEFDDKVKSATGEYAKSTIRKPKPKSTKPSFSDQFYRSQFNTRDGLFYTLPTKALDIGDGVKIKTFKVTDKGITASYSMDQEITVPEGESPELYMNQYGKLPTETKEFKDELLTPDQSFVLLSYLKQNGVNLEAITDNSAVSEDDEQSAGGIKEKVKEGKKLNG
jgi:hypothetical protein